MYYSSAILINPVTGDVLRSPVEMVSLLEYSDIFALQYVFYFFIVAILVLGVVEFVIGEGKNQELYSKLAFVSLALFGFYGLILILLKQFLFFSIIMVLLAIRLYIFLHFTKNRQKQS